MFKQACDNMPSGPEKEVFVVICRLYGLWQVEEQGAYFLKCELGLQARENGFLILLALQTDTLTLNRWTKCRSKSMDSV